MGGYELRVWRKGMEWSQQEAADALGVSRRTYVMWEKSKGELSKMVSLSTRALSMNAAWPDMVRQMNIITTIAKH